MSAKPFAFLGISRIATQFLQLTTFIVCARWIDPESFGIYALVLAVSSLGLMFNDFGMQSALVYSEEATRELASSLFWLNLGVGVGLAAVISALSFPISLALNLPELAGPLVVGTLSFALSAALVPTALLERRFQFGRIATCELLAQVAASTFAVVGAMHGWGVYALAGSPAAGALVSSILLLAYARFLPALTWSTEALLSVKRFATGMVGFAMVNYLVKNVDNFALGRLSTPTELGLYSRGYTLGLGPVGQIGSVVGRVLFPRLTRLRNDVDLVRREWLSVVGPALGLIAPLLIGLGCGSDDIVRLTLPPAWSRMTTVIELMAIAGVAQLLSACFGCVFQTFGRTHLHFKLAVVQLALWICIVVPTAPRGAVTVAAMVAVGSWLYLPLPVIAGLRLLRLRAHDLLGALLPALAGAVTTWLVAWGISNSVQSELPRESAIRLCLTLLASVILALGFAKLSQYRLTVHSQKDR